MIDVSVVVICMNEVGHMRRCLETLVAQGYPAAHFEVLVVDGGSQDGTTAILDTFSRQQAHVRWITEPRRGAAVARNTGLLSARFRHVAFIDADCEASPDWLERLVHHFQDQQSRDPTVVAVGGGNVPLPDAPPFIQAISIAMDSYAGSFNSVQGRRIQEAREVSSLATLNVLYDREPLLKIGGFDATLGSDAEDADLNYRLRQAGHRLIYIPELPVFHKLRATPALWSRNMFRYGRGRARLLKRHPAMWSLAYLLPLLFLAGMATLLLFPFSPLFGLPLLYVPTIAILSAILCWRHSRLDLMAHVCIIFVVQHFGYALGEVVGLLRREKIRVSLQHHPKTD
ncbi:MAG: glycosyltransferase [Magnetococcales bacterium]|nr:glycosyltransferase [Magnetococcales bacterium]